MPPGRPHGLNEEGVREQLADLMVRGMNAPEIAEVLGKHPDTILTWRKDEEVQTLVARKRRERVNRFVSKIDTELENRLEHPEKLSVAELVKIRQSLMPRAAGSERPDPSAARRAWQREDQQTAQGAPAKNG